MEKTQETEKNTQSTIEKRLEIYSNKIRLQIFLLLVVYGELSLADLSHHMKKSKPALHYHLRKMLDLDIIKVSREEPVRGSILAKYYSLGENGTQLFHSITEVDITNIQDSKAKLKLLKNFIDLYKVTPTLFQNLLELIKSYADLLEKKYNDDSSPQSKALAIQRMIFNEYMVNLHIYNFTETQYQKLAEYGQDFLTKVQTLISADSSDNSQQISNFVERPYSFIMAVLPLKKLLDLDLSD